jgi:hypothetical protein
VAKDSTLLFLEKYLLNLADKEDVSKQIAVDIEKGIRKHKSMPKSNTIQDA